MRRLPSALSRPVAGVLILLGLAGCSRHTPSSQLRPEAPAAAARVASRPIHVAPLGRARFRVCALGFNSPLELEAIRSSLPPEDFVFTDLTPTSDELPAGATSDAPGLAPAGGADWLLKRCRPDLRCDVVVYSGEFAGAFFGSYGTALELQDMEEASCQPRCRGLFREPREAFLLACNTLATKAADNRSPAEYLQVLLVHGFSRADAERVVDLRYGPLGPSFRESLRRIFAGVPRIYGFSSVAPRGEVTAPRLQEYFRRKGDYADYLTRVDRDTSANREILQAFAGTALTQTTGVMLAEPVMADRELVCRLYDEDESMADRLRIVRQMLSRPDFLTFVPTIEKFLARHPPAQLSASLQPLFRQIQSLPSPRRQMLELIARLHVSALKMQLAHLAAELGWITPQELQRLAVEGARQLLAEPISSETADIACEIARYGPAGADLTAREIPDYFFLHWEGFRLLDCLAPRDPGLSTRMTVGLSDTQEPIRFWAAVALSRRPPLSEEVLLALLPSLADTSPRVQERTRLIYSTQKPLPRRVLTLIHQRDPALARRLESGE